MRNAFSARPPLLPLWFGVLLVGFTLFGVAAPASGAEGAGSRRESKRTEEPISAQAFVEAQLKARNYQIVQLLQVRAPQGFPTGDQIEYFEAMGAYVGRRPQTIQLAIVPSGRSYRILKIRTL